MKRVVLDTNQLLLFLVGNHTRDWMNWKHLQDYDADDLRWLNKEVKGATHCTLPNILTEAAYFLGSGSQYTLKGGWELLARYAQTSSEVYKPSHDVVADPTYARLGLTDAAIGMLAKDKVTVITVDFELANRLVLDGLDAINPRHFKTPRKRKRL